MKQALLIVDYQYDFVAADGLLTAGQPARDIEAYLWALAGGYCEEDLYFTLDAHKEQDWEALTIPETRVFPPHCIKGTEGYELYGKLNGMGLLQNYIDKQAYCPPFEICEKLVVNYDRITIVGVVTDICVFQTAVGLYTAAINRKKPVVLQVDPKGCASFNPEREKWALQYMQEVLGIEV